MNIKAIDIINTKNKLIKLGIQIEDSIELAKTDKVRASRKESLNAIQGTLELISDLQMSLSRSSIKVDELKAYIEATNKDKFKKP
jgi:hypothetical protein